MDTNEKMTESADQNNNVIDLAFHRANHIVFKDYLKSLSQLPIVELNVPQIEDAVVLANGKIENRKRDLCAYDNAGFFKVKKLVYDSDENNIQKLTSVYSAMAAIHANPAIIIISNGMNAELYLGISNEDDRNRIRSNTEAFCNNITGNFQGSLDEFDKIRMDKDEIFGIINRCFSSEQNAVSSVSGVASIRNDDIDDNAEFSQGIEKLLDAMRGKPFSALFIANSVSSEGLADIKAEYELLYSSLVPFAKSSLTINDSQSDSVSKTLSQSLADTVGKNSSTALSIGTNESQAHQEGTSIGHTDSFGVNVGFKIGKRKKGGVNFGANYSHSIQRTKSFSDTTTFGKSETSTKTEGQSTAHTISQTDSDGTTKTYSVGKSLQISYENKTVTDLLAAIDAQLERIKASESFGMFATSAYFIATNKPIAQMAASTYKAIISGHNTGLEVATINTWDKEHGFDKIVRYLSLIRHPVFKLDEINNVTPASLVSAQELAIQMGLPNQSASGVTVIESASFGRNITQIDASSDSGKRITLGKLYHMGQADKSYPVELDLQSLAMHTFITGSTGAGKSNTVFQILSELKKAGKTFLVVEPAKGEYKHIFGGADVAVYGTNPNVTELLRINPFSFPKGIHILEHLDRLVEIFNVCWPMYAAMPAVLKESIERAYISAGWDLQQSTNRYSTSLYPTFTDVLSNIQSVMDESAYSSDNKGDYTGALSVRIKSLTNGINGLIFTTNSLSDKELFDENVIVDLSRVGSTETKSLIMGLLVMKLQEYRLSQSEGVEKPLQHITVLEEAHNLLKRTSSEQSMDSANLAGKSVEMLANAIAEMRAYGEGFIIADQAPGLLDMAVIRNTNTKIIMRLPSQEDRELVGRASGLNDNQVIELSRLSKGVAAVYQNNWIEAVLCNVDYYEHKSVTYKARSVEKGNADDSLKITILNAILRNELAGRFDKVDYGIIKSTLPTEFKCRLFDFLKSNDNNQLKSLSKLTYAFFNSSDIMSHIRSSSSVEDFKRIALEYIEPSLKEYSDKEKDLVLFMLIHEQSVRNPNFLPLYLRFSDFKNGGVK